MTEQTNEIDTADRKQAEMNIISEARRRFIDLTNDMRVAIVALGALPTDNAADLSTFASRLLTDVSRLMADLKADHEPAVAYAQAFFQVASNRAHVLAKAVAVIEDAGPDRTASAPFCDVIEAISDELADISYLLEEHRTMLEYA